MRGTLPPQRLTQVIDDRLDIPFRRLGAASHHVLYDRVPIGGIHALAGHHLDVMASGAAGLIDQRFGAAGR